MAFKIADAFVAVTPKDDGFEAELRRQIADATDGVTADVGLRLNKDALTMLDEDVKAAVDLATQGVKANVGMGLRTDAVGALDADVKAGVDLVETDAKVKVSVDSKAAQDAGAQGGGLIMAAIVGAAAIGAPVLLATLGTAFVGLTGLALAENKTIRADYATLGTDAEKALTTATAPLAGTMHQAVTQLEGDLTHLQPQLDGLFANVEPDITTVTGGLGSLVSNMLPGLSTALGNSQADVKDFSQALGPLGSSVGSFFTGLTTDASTTGAGLQSVLGVVGNTVSTLGSVLGSASSGISADLLAIDPAINGLLGGVRAISNPATVTGVIGAFGAMKLDPAISTGLKSASTGMFDLASKTEGATGFLGKVSGAALSSSTGLEKMAGVMGGPWGIAIGAGVGILSGLAGMLFESSHASDALTVSSQDLAAAIAKDGNTVGANTAGYIAQQDAANGLAQAAANAGISLATYTQAVTGNKAAQAEVTGQVETYNQVLDNQAASSGNAAASTGKFTDEQKDAQSTVLGAAAANNTLTDANKQLLASMAAQNKQITDQIDKQTQLTQATNLLNNSQSIFNASLKGGYQAMIAQSQASAMTSISALNLGTSNYGLNQSLYQSVTAYNNAQTAGNAYTAILNSQSGTINSLLGAEAAFTTSLSGVSAAVKANGTSLDVNSAKGAANITALTGIATAADKAAGAVYDNEVATKGSAQAYNDANTKLAQEKEAFIQAAEKAGLSKTAVQQLADELFKLPANVKIGVDTTSATTGLTDLIKRINGSHGTVTVYENSSGYVGSTQGGVKAHAAGGPAAMGQAYAVGDSGRTEVFVAPTDGYIYPSVAQGQKAIDEHNTRVTAASAKSAPMPPKQVTVNQHFHGSGMPGVEDRFVMRREMALAIGTM